jgi:5-methyltetrahydropteroyltriglutamate--homocysteine methyltransferase
VAALPAGNVIERNLYRLALAPRHREKVEGLDDCEIWIYTCWGNPNMQRVIENDSYAESFELYMERCRGDVWTVEMKDRGFRDLELFGRYQGHKGKKICIGVVSHRSLQVDRPEDIAAGIRSALKSIDPENLIISTDCGFGRQGCNREIAFFKSVALVEGTNIVRRELGLPATDVPAANAMLQTDIVPPTAQ